MAACNMHSHSSAAAAVVSQASKIQGSVALGRRRVRCAAQASRAGSDGEDRKPLSSTTTTTTTTSGTTATRELKEALGIGAPDSEANFPLAALLDKVEAIADDVTEATENGTYQFNGTLFVLFLFPVWLLYLLAAAEAIKLPFPLPFLDM